MNKDKEKLNEMSYEETILTKEGYEKLKEELMEGINEAIGLDEEPIVNIYFTEFIVQ